MQKRIAAFTSVSKDFDINVLKSNDLNLQSVSDPVVLVVKKNKRILNNLIKWLSKSRDDTTGKIMLPIAAQYSISLAGIEGWRVED